MHSTATIETTQLGPLLLDMGMALLRAGASSGKIRLTMLKIAQAYHCEPHIQLGGKSIALTLRSSKDPGLFNGIRSTDHYGVDFGLIARVGNLGRSIIRDPLPVEQLRGELDRLLQPLHYPRYLVLLMVGIAGASFCFTFGGSAVEMAITFGATCLGLFVKQEGAQRKLNAYFCTFIAALVATTFVALFYKLGPGEQLEHAFATSVLFLVPGVPLINAFTDLLEGEILNGLEKGVNALNHALAIASAMAIIFSLFNVHQ